MKNLILIITILAWGMGCSSRQKLPEGIFTDFTKLAEVKNQIRKDKARYLPPYQELLLKAGQAMNENIRTVTDKKRIPPGGSIHDYLSMGPYWWPDTTKADGLPYIRRDGEVNPETHGEYTDTDAKNQLFKNMELLGLAYFFSGEDKYAQKAVEYLNAWFIQPETRMNPNLQFAQGIPGRMDGRGIGIIDWAGINKIVTSIQILDASGFLSENIKSELFAWFDTYLKWLLNSEYGKDEDDYFNNHGTWFDVQAVGIQLLLGKKEDAAARLEQAKTKRIASQIEPDGSQPHELARTKSLGYSTMNLRGFLYLAILGEKTGVDIRNFVTTDGRSIKKALDFLLPYAAGNKTWEYPQLGNLDDAVESLKTDYLMAATIFDNPEYLNVALTIKQPGKMIETLMFPLPDQAKK